MHRNQNQARVLWVTEEPPDRTLGGGSIRQARLFQALAGFVRTDLLVIGPVADAQVRSLAADLIELPMHRMPHSNHAVGRRALDLAIVIGSKYPSAMYGAGANRRALAQAACPHEHEYDLVCVEHEALAPLIPRTRAARWMITFHHVLSGMINEELRMAPGRRQRWFRARDLAKAQRLERWTLRSYDRCIVCSDVDAARLTRFDDDSPHKVAVIPNGVDLEALQPTPLPEEPRVLLPGTFSWPPNVDGAVWLCTEVWPRVRARVPDATLVLAGRTPAAEVIELGRMANVSVEADVPSMTPYFEAARVVAVPLRIGTGTRLKALEAMSAGRPIVGTHIGLEGIGIEDRVHARIADDAEGFAAAMIELLQSDSANTLGRAARSHVERRFGWDRVGDDFVRLVSTLLDHEAPPQSALRSSSNSA
jgi:glycosyltransferase involved in cell wall biosynthesis